MENSVIKTSKESVKNTKWLTSSPYAPKISREIALRNSLENNHLTARIQKSLFEILPYFKPVTLASGDYLYQPGDYVHYLYFPETAVVSEFQTLEDGRIIEVAMVGNEGVLGLLPLLDSCRAVNFTQVAVGGRAVKIDSGVFEQKVVAQRSFQKLLFEYISRYVNQISHRLVCNSYHLIEQRFCSWLLMLQDRQQGDRLPLTQEQIARSLGVHRPSITHIAQTLRTKKIIDYVRGSIYILDRRALENSACACFSEK